jgi:hypothetical protein
MDRHQIKVHPDIQIETKLPINYMGLNWIISYKTTLFIDGKYVLRFKTSMLLRADRAPLPEYSHSVYVKMGFLPPKDMETFYSLANHCYQTAVIEFNKTLDIVNASSPIQFRDTDFISLDEVKKMVDNALNPSLN